MAGLDIRTLTVMYVMAAVIELCVTVMLWLQYRKRYAGLKEWIAFAASQVISLGLLASSPDAAGNLLVSNIFIFGGYIFLLSGCEGFVRARSQQIVNGRLV